MTVRPALLTYPGVHAPHAVLEVNQCCNLSCRACYKRKSGYTKPYRLITEEVDALLSHRNLSTITLAGGEPTLHPQLPEIIEYCAGKGLIVQMISNGLEVPDELLERCRRAGLRDFLLHVDSLQNRPDAPRGASETGLFPLREALIGKVSAHGIDCALGLTVYRSTLDELPAVISWMLAEPRLKRLVVFCCGDVSANMHRFAGGKVLETTYSAAAGLPSLDGPPAGETLEGEEVGVADVEALLAPLGMRPVFYVASSRSAEERRWLVYHSLALHGVRGIGDVLHLEQSSPRVTEFLQRLARRAKKPAHFGRHLDEARCLGLAVLHALTCGRLKEARRALKFCARRLRTGARISSRPITVQQPAAVLADGRLVHCRDCPDATIRNGTLVPVCMADYLVGPSHSPAADEPS